MIDMEELKVLAIGADNFRVTKHMAKRLKERGIKFSHVRNALLNGEIIEQYPDDYPYPSCLVSGFSEGKETLHVCVGFGDGKLWLITAYYPDTNGWEPDFKTRKAVE